MSAFLRKTDRLWKIPAVYFAVLTLLAWATPLAFAPYRHFWLMPLLFGAFVRLTELKPKRAIVSAYWFAWAGYSAQFWWIHTALHDVSGLPNLYAVPLTVLLPAFLALFPATVFWIYEHYRLPRWLGIGLALPVLWTLGEFARERALTGFGWGALGYSQIADYSPLAGFAPVGGIHMVSLATACLACWLVLSVDNCLWRQRLGASVLIVALLATGHYLRGREFTHKQGEPVSVALAQGNIPQTLKFDEAAYRHTYRRYFEQVAHTKAQIVVLPETAFPQFLQNLEPGLLTQFAETAQRNGSALAVGIPAFSDDGEGYLNAVINLADYRPEQPNRFQIYAKNHLVPFGEYKPLPMLTEPLYRMMNMPLADFRRGGSGQRPFDMAGQKVAFNICYEDGFGDELIASAREATLLANSSNMAWYGKSNAMWQHLQQSQARALELGRFMIRATNTGATAIVSPQGKITAQAEPDTAAVLEAQVQGMSGETPYMRMGGSLPLIGLLSVLAGLLFWFGRKKQTVSTVSGSLKHTDKESSCAP